MCPISGLVQFLIVLVTLLLICHGVISQKFGISYKPNNPTVHMYQAVNIDFNITGPDISKEKNYMVIAHSAQDDIATVEAKTVELTYDLFGDTLMGNFNVSGVFLGKTNIVVKVRESDKTGAQSVEYNVDSLPVTVIRLKRVIDTVFTASVATLVSILYVNFGCALEWPEIKATIRKPIAPVIGFVGQFLFMPLLSYGLGKVLFPDSTEMQLGMFFTGVSPGGGASNMWAVILGGNLSLSITMTTISTFAAFAMMPLWIFTLGRVLFERGKLMVPYREISTYAIALVIPLLIGYLIQRYLQRVGKFFAKILKGFSSILLIFIVVFAIVTNLYLFELFSWQIVCAGLGLPWLGYSLAFLLAKACKQSTRDCLTIAIETGIQNTGIAIFLLRFALPQPEADLTTVAPVCVAIMTPIPLIAIFVYQKVRDRFWKPHIKLEKLTIPSDVDNNCNKDSYLIQTIS